MSPFEQAAQWYAKNPGMFSLEEAIEAHAQCGYVIITPEIFMLGRRVSRDMWQEDFSDPWLIDPTGNCWHVWFTAGDWNQWERHQPFALPWVSMHRRDKLRIYPLSRFSRLK